jgi:hypothetical protein
MNSLLDRIGHAFIRIAEQTGLWFRMLWRTVKWGVRPPYSFS